MPAESNRRMNMVRANEKTIEMTKTAELTGEQLETVAGGTYRFVRAFAIAGGNTSGGSLWVTSATSGKK